MKYMMLLTVSLCLLWNFAAGIGIPRFFEGYPLSCTNLTAEQVTRELGDQVSQGTLIFGPEDSRFNNATSRFSDVARPIIHVVVQPAEESDVSTIVNYCNENSIDFLAVNRGHGSTLSLATFNGIQIDMVKLDSITVQPDGKSAWFQGGVYSGQVSDYLWERGYVATTGACDCVGLLGAGLGGGHGRHEGLYGLIVDNMLQLNVVLGDGHAIRVDESSYGDLFWGMKGAGHNFGIVTGLEMKIHPRGPDTWHYHNYIWNGDKLEVVFTALNNLHGNGSTPVNMVNFGYFLMNPTINKEEPIIAWSFSYRGSAEEAQIYLSPFDAIESVSDESGDVPYPQVAHIQSTGLSDFACQHHHQQVSTAAGLQVYNLTAERKIFDGFKRRIHSDPDIVARSSILHEGYATAGVDAQDPKLSAYPFRTDHHLMICSIGFERNNANQEGAAWEWAKEIQNEWNAGQPERTVNVYVNYANGMESIEERYGHEAWRIERLQNLKAKYDPQNKFRFFNPIVAAEAQC
ncbi:hypothetical protein GGS21DRAFT_541800 [Xylaria nigripes]|nr:hypothetical protein GGS21DRAFT_541800 [Xylaria nigripes]